MFVAGYDFISDLTEAGDGNGRDANPQDLGGDSGYHGSHVAATAAACSNDGYGVAGVAWASRILPVRVFNGDAGTLSDVAKGIYWAAGIAIPASVGSSVPVRMASWSRALCSISSLLIAGHGTPMRVCTAILVGRLLRSALVSNSHG